MLSGFEINFLNVLRLFTLIRYERMRRTGRYRAATRCFTSDLLYWEIDQDGAGDRVYVRERAALESSFYTSDEEFIMESVVPIDSQWSGDQVTSHWRAVMRVPGGFGRTQRVLNGYTRILFRGRLIHEMVTVFTSVHEPAQADA